MVIANIAIGTVLSAIAIRYLMRARFVKPEQLGLNKSRLRTATIITLGAAGGLILFLLQNPRTTEPIVVFNVFMQAFPVSIAEVMVCWALIGSSFESLAKNRSSRKKSMSVIVGAVAASVLFGVYQPEVDKGNITLLGISEGTTIAPRIAAERPNNVKNIVLMSTASQTLYEIMHANLVNRTIFFAQEVWDDNDDGLLSLQEVSAHPGAYLTAPADCLLMQRLQQTAMILLLAIIL